MQSRKNFRYKLHRTPNNTQIPQHKLRVAFSYLERNYTLNESEYDLKDYAGRGGLVPGREVLRISSYRDDRMGPKITPPKKKKSLGLQTQPQEIPGPKSNPPPPPPKKKKKKKKPCMPNFRAINISRGTSRPGYEGTIKNLKIVWIPPLPPKKTLLKSSYPKKSRNRKFQTPKNPWIIPVTWNPEYPPLPWGLVSDRGG